MNLKRNNLDSGCWILDTGCERLGLGVYGVCLDITISSQQSVGDRG